MKPLTHSILVFAITLTLAPSVSLADVVSPITAAASGPTPYPKDAKDWPGQGAIRVFGYMNDNRKWFWTEREKKQGSVVFVGDSLIGGWTTLGKDMPGLPVANRGIGGEVSRGLLFRFQEDVLDLHPKAIVLLSGSNDLSALQNVQQTRSNLADMLDMAERMQPGLPIVLCTIPPRANPQAPVDPKQLAALNKAIVSVAQGRPHVVVLDLYTLMADPDGSPHAEYFGGDKIHITPAGYQVFRDALTPLFKQLNVG